MKKGKPFYFRLEPLQLMTALIQIPESERGIWITQVAVELSTGEAKSDFALSLFAEAEKFQKEASERSRIAGLASAEKRQQALTDVERTLTDVQQEFNPTQPSKQLAVSSKQLQESKEERGDKSPPPSTLFNLWNQIIKEPRATVMNKTRDTKCRLRLKERTPDEWAKVFEKIKSSDFCTGGNDRGWKADFDWIISNDSNAIKVLEGKFDNKSKNTGGISDDFRKRFLEGSGSA